MSFENFKGVFWRGVDDVEYLDRKCRKNKLAKLFFLGKFLLIIPGMWNIGKVVMETREFREFRKLKGINRI